MAQGAGSSYPGPEPAQEPEPEPVLTDRLFFAVMPDAAAIADIKMLAVGLKTCHGMRGRLIADAKLHATLCFLGGYPGLPASVIARAGQAAALVAAATPEFDVAFDAAQSFVNRARNRPFVLTGGDGAAGLTALYDNLAQALLKAGIGGDPRTTRRTSHCYMTT